VKSPVIVLVLALARAAYAFPTGSQFDLDPLTSDGAGGIAFDGAPRFSGHTCEVCHTGAEKRIGARIEADKPELFTQGWLPNQQYHLRVVLTDAHAAMDAQAAGDACGFDVMPFKRCDNNGFALEIDNLDGKPTGKLGLFAAGACATGMAEDPDAYVLTDGTAVTHNGLHHGQLAWNFCWTAPAAGAGLLTAYLSVVDGNGGLGTEAFPYDVVNDDVMSGAVPIVEAGAPPPFGDSGGCAAAGHDGSVLLVLLALPLVVRRRRTWLAALLAVATASGCVHVRPRQRETLARKNMKFAPDPTEDELDLHMQEAREGSSGGYGSSGGGCGCN
jgi:Synergist-CTERM protein sorting domain-containing protein